MKQKIKVKEERNRYIISGFMIVSFWGGGTGWCKLKIHADEGGLRQIEAEPLQDYLAYGVEAVDYFEGEVFRVKEIETDEFSAVFEFTKPVKRIEAGAHPEVDKFRELSYESEPVVIYYGGWR